MFNKDRDTGIAGLSSSGQAHAVTASFLGWTLDAFDFFVVVFLIDKLAAEFHVGKEAIIASLFVTLVMRPVGALIFGLMTDRYGRRIPLMANVVFFSVVELACGFSPNFTFFLIMRALYGIGMGGEWGIGASLAMESVPPRLARNSFRNFAERLFAGLLACGDRGAVCAAHVGMAADVLAGRIAGAAGVLYQRARAGVGSVETASRAVDGRGAEDRGHAVEEFSLSRAADDLHDVPVARHAGPLSGFSRQVHKVAPAMQSYMAILYNIGAIVGAIIFGQSRKSWAEGSDDRGDVAWRCW